LFNLADWLDGCWNENDYLVPIQGKEWIWQRSSANTGSEE